MRSRLPLEVHQQAFLLILAIVEQKGLLRGRVAGVDSTFLRADASMKTIVRRDTKESYPKFIKRLAEENGMENPTEEDARRFDRSRKGKKMSNKDWKSPTDSGARIAKLKDGRTRMAYKPEHVVDLETGALVGVAVHQADRLDMATIEETLEVAQENLQGLRDAESSERKDDDIDDNAPPGASSSSDTTVGKRSVVADKGYNKAEVLRQLKESGYRTYIPEKRQKGKRKWTDKGGRETAAAFYENRARVGRKKGKALQRKRGELLERTFAHICETGAARRTCLRADTHRQARLRGLDNVNKRYLIQASGANLGLVMRSLFGRGTPRGMAEALRAITLAVSRCMSHRGTLVDALWALFTNPSSFWAPSRAV